MIGHPVTIVATFSALFQRVNPCRVTQILAQFNNTIFSGVSLLALAAISVDRLLALLLRLRYRQVVSVKRVRSAVFLFWIMYNHRGRHSKLLSVHEFILSRYHRMCMHCTSASDLNLFLHKNLSDNSTSTKTTAKYSWK